MKRALFLLFLILSLIPVTAESSKNQQYAADYKGMEAGGDIPRWIKYADNDNLKKIASELKIEKEKKVLLYKTESNSLSMAKSGEYFVSAGEDKELKIWEYDTAIPKWRGLGHSTTINRIAISPNQEFIVSVGADGSIFLFETPMEIRLAKADQNMPK